jgi:hypothetical protein
MPLLQPPTRSRETLFVHSLNTNNLDPRFPEKSHSLTLYIIWWLSNSLSCRCGRVNDSSLETAMNETDHIHALDTPVNDFRRAVA